MDLQSFDSHACAWVASSFIKNNAFAQRSGNEVVSHPAPRGDLLGSPHHDIGRRKEAIERAVISDRALVSRQIELLNDEQVDIAVGPVVSAGTRAEQHDPLWLTGGAEPLDRLFHQLVRHSR